jgi:hypothetical protein
VAIVVTRGLQVCRQVFDALTYALELDEPAIAELTMVSVTPAPSAARVQVNLVPEHAGVDREAALARRAAVASSCAPRSPASSPVVACRSSCSTSDIRTRSSPGPRRADRREAWMFAAPDLRRSRRPLATARCGALTGRSNPITLDHVRENSEHSL